MIGYLTLGTNDLDKSKDFFDEVLAPLNAKQLFSNDRLIFWGKEMGKPMLAVGAPYDGNPATVGNGVMVALSCRDKAIVEQVYEKALALGGQGEGEPGFRTNNFYGAYFRDLDGNKFAVFCMA